MSLRRLCIAALAVALGGCASVPAPAPVAEPAPAETDYRALVAEGWRWVEIRTPDGNGLTLEPPR